ncbi:hypothetical protein HOW07_13405 [Plantibacter sp. MCCC 1A11337]|uniref:hypothetical protein n=1 Tax=Plantibacter TaxID=190323 RepID=UPI00099C7D41|nr:MULTISPECIES: hypothetical protein [Plantibacter]AQX81144.1 hypothetical protein BWO91_15235 [Plantibacter flavus]NUJ89005.1 hypothetical protein [Plantibacter sp. MCCC 1A11337]
MLKKITAVFALALAGLFIAPVAANASYVPGADIVVTGDVAPGGTFVVTFTDGAFQPNEDVSLALTGENATGATLAAVDTKTLVKTASATGSVSLTVTLPTNATGTYTVTGTGLSSQIIGTTTVTVKAAAAGGGSGNGGLADTGFNTPAFLVWGAAGAVVLGAALIAVFVMIRRQRAGVAA